jgi:amino acid transporter
MKWLAFAAFLLILWIPIETLSGTIAWLVPVAAVGPVLLTLALTAIALAVLRYRLYEIDRIISRTVSYALVIALLLGIFFGTVTLLTSLLPTDSSLAVAASTLAVFALFNPARKRIQDRVDRRFNRSRYQSNQVLDRFAVDLRDQTDFDQLTAGLTSVVLETLHPVGLGIWISDGADAT